MDHAVLPDVARQGGKIKRVRQSLPPYQGPSAPVGRAGPVKEIAMTETAPPAYAIDQLISAKAIAARVEGLAREITAHFQGTDKLVVVGLLRGSFVFIADLVREIELPVEVDFLEASSYGDAMHSSREVRILKDLRGEIAGRDVLVVEDIVDTGFTLHHVIHLLQARGPRQLKVCALLDKPTRREVAVKADWTGFEIPDEFVVGYGIDFAQRNRNLPYIGKVRFTGAP
jgi:hypoxanthine phosphoribosyltransferase